MSKYQTIALSEAEDLPWPEYIPTNATKLILGTFPTKKKLRKFNFFYPNSNNPFWNVLAEIAGHTIQHKDNSNQTVEERKQILDELDLGITDMGAKVLRLKDSSADSALFPVEFSDIFQILTDNPQINTLILTSSSSGHSVFSWLKDYCSLNDIKLRKPEGQLPWTMNIPWSVRPIKIIAVCSPSRQAAKEITELTGMYRQALKFNKP